MIINKTGCIKTMDKVKKHTIRVRYVILSVIGFVLAVIIGIVTIALVSYKSSRSLQMVRNRN